MLKRLSVLKMQFTDGKHVNRKGKKMKIKKGKRNNKEKLKGRR